MPPNTSCHESLNEELDYVPNSDVVGVIARSKFADGMMIGVKGGRDLIRVV